MILHSAVLKLREVAAGMGAEDGDLIYQHLPKNHVCQFCSGSCMGTEFGGRVAEVATPAPFSACMRLEHLYTAPLKSARTRAAALGALNAAAGFLMLTRKTGPCNSVLFDDCLAELVKFCAGKAVYIVGADIPGLTQTLLSDDAELIIITGDALLDDAGLAEVEDVLTQNKEILFLGQNCLGLAALMQLPVWCPYGT